MSDIADDDLPDPHWRDDAPEPATINEAGTPGFAVDGTDSFAVPGDPVDGLPPLDRPGDRPPWRRLLVTLGAAVIVLTLVVVVETAGRDTGAARVRSETTVPGLTLPSPFSGVTGTSTTLGDTSDMTLTTTAGGYVPAGTYEQPTVPVTTINGFDTPTRRLPTYQPYVPSYRPSVTYRSYIPPLRIFPRVTIPPLRRPPTTRTTTTTTTATTTFTTTTTTTKPKSTSTTTIKPTPTTTKSTQPAPASKWVPSAPLGSKCADDVWLWAGPRSTLAAVGAAGWRSVDGGKKWTKVSGVGSPTAFAEDTSADGPAWVGTDDGVFEIGSDPPHELGDLKNVTSLSAVTVGTPGTTTLVAVAHKEVRRWNGTAWVTIDLPEGEPGEVLVLDEKQILLGTSTGILQSTDGGPFAPIDTAKAGVIGAPVRHGNTITWLLTGGTGVLRQADAGAPWTSTPSPAIAGATSLAVDAKGMLLAPGATARVVRSSDGGKSWTALTDQPKYRPDGIVHSAEAAVIWISGCAALTVDPADAVLRLTDG